MNPDIIEHDYRTFAAERGVRIDLSEPVVLYPPWVEFSTPEDLEPVFDPPALVVGSPRMGFRRIDYLRPEKLGDVNDLDYLYWSRFSPGRLSLLPAITVRVAEITGRRPYESGGTRRRTEERHLGSDLLMPHIWLHAASLLRQGTQSVHESDARAALLGIRRYGLNHDLRAAIESNFTFDALVPAIAEAIQQTVNAQGIPCQTTQDSGGDFVLHASKRIGLLYAPWTVEGFLFRPLAIHYARRNLSLYPAHSIAEAQISTRIISPEGNPRLRLIEVRESVVDILDNPLDYGSVVYITPDGISGDHRGGQANFRQQRQIILGSDGWYKKTWENMGPFDGIPEDFSGDEDFAYCTLLRMAAEALEVVYQSQYRGDDMYVDAIEGISHEVQSSTERLMATLVGGQPISRYKIIEGLQQIIKFSLMQPHAWAIFADTLKLGRIFPRAKALFEMMHAVPLYLDGVRTDDFATSAMTCHPAIHLGECGYSLDEISTIHYIVDYAEHLCGIQFPPGLSPLGKLAWLYEPFAQ